MTLTTLNLGDRVRVDDPTSLWNGRTGVVTRLPGERATDGHTYGTYAVRFDGEKESSAPLTTEYFPGAAVIVRA